MLSEMPCYAKNAELLCAKKKIADLRREVVRLENQLKAYFGAVSDDSYIGRAS